MKSINTVFSRRLLVLLLALSLMLGALALAPAASASGPCMNAGCDTGCVSWDQYGCSVTQTCCVCTCGAYACTTKTREEWNRTA